MMNDSNVLIKVKNVKKIYGKGESEVRAVNDIDLEVNKGEFVALLGASGSGKSTLLHILGAMDKPTSGDVIFNDKSIVKMNERKLYKFRLRSIGFIFQTFNLIPSLTALENVMLPMRLNKVSRSTAKKRALELLEMVDLKDRANHIPAKLSGGQKQRVAIARALANNPSLILADEPTGNLDSKNSDKIMKILHALNDKGYTILMVTHNLDLAKEVTKVISMKDGKII
jgi:putative ABC transport system ATP-binding protein